MKARRLLILLGLAAILLLASLAPGRLAGAANAPQEGFELAWATIDGGGAVSLNGGPFSLGVSIGQADAAAVQQGGAYSLSGGFWVPHNPVSSSIYLPILQH